MADHVFISYAKADEGFVLPLARRLRRSGVRVWVFQWELVPGTNWERTIEDALYDCAHFLIVLSPAAMDSEEVRGELRTALNEGKPILPVYYRDCRLPPRLPMVQYVDYRARGVENQAALHQVLRGLGLRPSDVTRARRTLWADRWKELELFEQIAAGEREETIPLIESAGGMGKSTLLREFELRCAVMDAHCVPVDLKDGPGLADVLALLCRGVGWENLPSTSALAVELAGAGAPGGRPGHAALQTALHVPDEGTRRYRRIALTEALCADLCALPRRLVFVFDTLNNADPEVEEWLLGHLIESVRYGENLAAVVAGRPPLEPRTTWAARCACVRLERIDDAQAWHTGLHELHPSLDVSLQEIQVLCEGLMGHPLSIATALYNVARARSAAAGGRP